METELGSNKETTTSDLVDQASSDIGKLGAARAVAALLPCMQLYAFLGKELSRRKDLENHPYKEWIQSHASDAFQVSMTTIVLYARLRHVIWV